MTVSIRLAPVFVLVFACVMLPAVATAQVSWTEIQKPNSLYDQINWPVYPTGDSGLLLCLVSDPDGLYHSSDDGQTWTRNTINLKFPYLWPRLASTHQSLIPFLTCSRDGLYRVDPESGKSHRIPALDSIVVTWVAATPDGQRICVLGNSVLEARLLFISEDSGASWKRISVQDVEFSPQIASAVFTQDTLRISAYNRVIWMLAPGETTLHPVHHSLPQSNAPLWFLGDGLILMEYDSMIVRSNDNGETWRDTRTGLPSGPVSLHACARSSDGTVYALINDGDQYDRLFRSADRGRTWNRIDRDGDPRITRFQLTTHGEVVMQLGNTLLARSSGLALVVPVSEPIAHAMDAGIFPNPIASGRRATVWVSGEANIRWRMRIVDLRGAVRASQVLRTDGSGHVHRVIRAALAPGSYFIELASGMHRRLLRLRVLP